MTEYLGLFLSALLSATLLPGSSEVLLVTLAADHDHIAQTVEELAAAHQAVVVVHGTDRLATTGERIFDRLGIPRVPVVLTGAMRPYLLRNTDAMQNLTEALIAVQILPPGVYAVMHNKVLAFPGVVKDYESGTFRRRDQEE